MKICVIGAGYVGLITGLGFAKTGNTVICVDKNPAAIARLNSGSMHFFEEDGERYLTECLAAGSIRFTESIEEGLDSSEVVVIAVGTPQMEDGQADVSNVFACGAEIARVATKDKIVVVKSTVPVGTCDNLEDYMATLNPAISLPVVSNPEFLREGSAFADFFGPDRVVIGGRHPQACETVAGLYQDFARRGIPIFVTDPRTSELIKYASNSFLAMKVAFINEIANLCDAVNANVDTLAEAIGADKRIGKAFLKPGPGYGGSCFPKDTLALTAQAQEADCPIRIVEAVVASNAYHIRRLSRRVAAATLGQAAGGKVNGRSLAGKRIAVLGLAFKANTDDMRQAASLVIVPQLLKLGAKISAYDPLANEKARAYMPELEYHDDPKSALDKADLALILTEHREIVAIDWSQAVSGMEKKKVFDARNLFDPERMNGMGIDYSSLGRPAAALTGRASVPAGASAAPGLSILSKLAAFGQR